MFNKNLLIEKGFLDLPIDPNLDLIAEIEKLKKEKNAIILAHFYQKGEIQDIADYIGDSLKLSQLAAKTDADVIVFAGVHFMAETAKTLSPQKKVLLPDLNAGCSLADSCPADDFKKFIDRHPNHVVVSYVNTTNAIKALTDIVCTSSNAVDIVKSIPEGQKIIFAPDKNLGSYIQKVTGRDLVIWDGACHVHRQFSLERMLALKNENPDAMIVAHPECESPILIAADFVGSTSQILDYCIKSEASKFIVATESGILHQMKKDAPDKVFIPAPPDDSTCACNDCEYMKLNTIEKIYNCLKYEAPEITIEDEMREKAYSPIKRMLDISADLGL